MPAPFSTLLLDLTFNDLVLDVNGNIAVAGPPYSLAQDAASAIKAWLGEVYYDQTQGLNPEIMNRPTPLSVIKQACVDQAMLVPGVVSAQVFLSALDRPSRLLSGQVQVTDSNGVTTAASF